MARLKAPALPIDFDQQKADEALAEIGKLQREASLAAINADNKIAKIKAVLSETIPVIEAQIKVLSSKLQLWAEANRAELCKDGRKSFALMHGEIGWRLDPPSVKIKKDMEGKIIAQLKAFEDYDFIRVKEEVNKEEILNRREEVKEVEGLQIVQDEKFTIKPYQTEMEPVELVRKA